MTYTQALDYIRSANRPFCKPGLERVAALCEALGNPQDRLQIIHVTGTNGKGSFCAMLESVLRRGPYKTGLFTSPYIREINECMAVDGQSITDEELAELTAYIRPFADALEDAPTEFELLTAMAFVYFHRHECAVVVVETGMGGRLDSTNVIRHPLLSVITGISLDHTAFLGDTVEKIASEKAGIVKPGAPVLYGGEEEAAWQVVEAVAQAKGSPVSRMDYASLTCHRMTLNGTQFDYGDYRKMELSLLGTYQPRNAAVVLQAVDLLRSQGLAVPESAVREGLVQVQWPGRFQLLSAQPPVIFDGAHNAQGIAAAVDSIAVYFPKRKVLFLGDLDVEGGKNLLSVCPHEKLRQDIVQMAHHGQNGADKEFYTHVMPKICLYCAPDWLWENDNGGGRDSGPWKTLETRAWMEELGALASFPHAYGDYLFW